MKSLENKSPLALSIEFKEILDQLENSNEHAFITGRAGTGKSTLLQLFRKTTRKRCAVLAPTGIAALNVKGQTIHSFFGFPPKMINPSDIQKRPNHRLFKKLDTLIIDEISMVRADMMDNIDRFLRINRNINTPFGGVQMVLFGDLFQLPPVVASDFERRIFTEHYDSPYFFSSTIIQSELTVPMIELHQVYRQAERRFINLLDNIRTRSIDYDDMEEINSRYVDIPEDTDYFITLCSRNATADEINRKELAKLNSENFLYPAKITGNFQSRIFPTEQVLSLKQGAQVMFVKNDPQKRFVNGTIGKILHCDKETITVSIPDIHEIGFTSIVIEPLEWEIIKYQRDPDNKDRITTNIVGTFTQYPVKLAWAITIHKSQGKTFDKVIIDLGRGAFEYGQTYVALSRCKTLNGIILKNPIRPRDIMVDEKVREFYENKRYYL